MSQRPEPADALSVIWSTPPSDEIGATDQLRVDSGLVMARYGADGIIAYAADSGKEAWRLLLPDGGKPCAPPSPANEAGLAAVVFGKPGTDGHNWCSRVGVVDVRAGTLLWHTDFSGEMRYKTDIRASIGRSVLTVQLQCGDLRRFDARTSQALPTFLTPDRACAHSAGHNGRHVAVVNAPDDGTPEVAPGWKPIGPDATAEFALYDSETGAKLWGHPMNRRGLKVFAVVSSDPLVVDMEIESVRKFRVFDDQGHEVRTLGGEMTPSVPPPFNEQVVDGVWVQDVQLRSSPAAGLPAYDLATGRDLPGLPAGAAQGNERVVGISQGRLVLVRNEVTQDPLTKAVTGVAMRVVAHDLHTGEGKDVGQVYSGSFEKESIFQVVYARGDLLFVWASADSHGQLVTLRIPG
ncbi:PQQ-like beta-propeller repeat protein [Yinghuangia sp. ASG 101]|uniref:outer membrane protein assembly factor BamB family protein n=1 Tax=Yinghuangia sp. ASG 101 TaxID=2896848 RepID=UPI001E3CF330|nr:PQQ-binding-like beta-propeller repeat protein [Yinghuangia sp. ASG 101]UGQ14527.1 PQQ-like beta-propeller repeat protein [Yinghuangia sp. ASG 101]